MVSPAESPELLCVHVSVSVSVSFHFFTTSVKSIPGMINTFSFKVESNGKDIREFGKYFNRLVKIQKQNKSSEYVLGRDKKYHRCLK